MRAGCDLAVLGMVLASGLRILRSHSCATDLCLCIRLAAFVVTTLHVCSRIWSVPGNLQHQSVPVVQTGLVLSAIRHCGARACGERTDPLEQRWPSGAHLQSVILSTCRVFAGSIGNTRDRPDLGPGNSDYSVLLATYVFRVVSDRLALTILLRRHAHDNVGCVDDIRVWTDLLRDDRHLFLLRFLHSNFGFSGNAAAVYRSGNVAAIRAWPGDLWSAVRPEHRRVVSVAWRGRYADVLRQASASAGFELVDQGNRSRRAISLACGARSGIARPTPPTATAAPGIHVRLGRRVRRNECSAGSWRFPSRPMAAVLAASLRAGTSIRMPISGRLARSVLRSGLRLGLQRSRSPAHCARAVWRGSSADQARRSRGTTSSWM